MKRKIKYAVLLSLPFLIYYFYFHVITVTIDIYYTNDFHGNIVPTEAFWLDGKPLVGGSATLGAYLKNRPLPYLLLDAGDFIHGTPESNFTKGQSIIEIMNKLGYDAACVGNHEYDWGEENLIKLSQISSFSFLGANIYKANKPVGYVKPYIVKNVKNIKIGIFGVTTSDMERLVIKENIKDLDFLPEVETAQKIVSDLKKEKADIIIALTHIGIEKDGILAEKLEGIDLIIGGHNHSQVYKLIKKIPIVQTYGKGTTVGHIRLHFNRIVRRIIKHKNRFITLLVRNYGEDSEIKKLVKYYADLVAKHMDVVIGYASGDFLSSSNGESPLGNFITDVMRDYTSADVAFHNSGGIRANLLKGDITVRHLYNISPFENTVVTMELTGEQIKELLEQSVSGEQGILQVSGLKMEYNPKKRKGERVLNIWINNEKLRKERNYRVATNSFLAQGGDGFLTFKKAKNIKDTKKRIDELKIDYVKKRRILHPKIEKRIILTYRE